MSGTNSSGWPFTEDTSVEGLDINAIFGGGAPASDLNPFDAPAEQAEETIEPAQTEEPLEQPVQTAENTEEEPPAPKSEEEPVPPQEIPAEEANPIAAAFDKQEEKAAQAKAKSLFEKAPVFSYGSAREDITDPKGTTIRSVKEGIEQSKAFLDGLKKAKDKSPDCLVKPRVTAQSKGIASYKGVFQTLEEARASEKPICLIPGGDGRVYELRKTELGEFVAPKDKVIDFQQIRAGFTPALPLIPLELLQQIISFFRCFMGRGKEFEALAHILWDKETEEFTVHIPQQDVSKARIDADLSRDTLPEGRYLHYADIHSHNSMEARFSFVDDQDERATRIYIVLGRLDRFFPDISVRMSCGGTYQELDPGTVIEGLGAVFPREWRDNVHTETPASKGLRFLPTRCLTRVPEEGV